MTPTAPVVSDRLRMIAALLAPAVTCWPKIAGRPRFNQDLLLAIAAVESDLGGFNLPRFEPRWWTRLRDVESPLSARFAPWIRREGRQVAASFGPWQLMAFNAIDCGWPEQLPLALLSIPELSLPFVISFLNRQRFVMGLAEDGAPVHPRHADPKRRLPLTPSLEFDADTVDPILEVVGDVYNSGNSLDVNYPIDYCEKLKKAYRAEESRA